MIDAPVLDPVGHRYGKRGREYYSVTRILDESNCTGDKQWFKQEHRDRGSRVHSLVSHIVKLEHPSSQFEWDQTCSFADITPYGLACQRWCRDVGFEVLYSEAPVWDDDWLVAGTTDLIGILRKRGGIMAVIDAKSGAVPPSVEPQTAAYAIMAAKNYGIKIDARFSLLLRADKPEGDYKFRECKDPRDMAIWTSIYNTWNWRRANGLIAKEQ